MDMFQRCDILRTELDKRTEANPRHFDMLSEYRKWFDGRHINSETEDGWPAEFAFDEANIKAFVEYWREP